MTPLVVLICDRVGKTLWAGEVEPETVKLSGDPRREPLRVDLELPDTPTLRRALGREEES